MNPQFRNALEVIAFIIVVSLIWIAIPTHAHADDLVVKMRDTGESGGPMPFEPCCMNVAADDPVILKRRW